MKVLLNKCRIEKSAKVVLAIVLCGLLVSCLPSKEKSSQIVHANLGGHDIYIPKDYLKFGHTSVGNESALLQAWYPGAAIPPGRDAAKLLKERIWWKNIMILISVIKPKLPFSVTAPESVKYLKATELVGKEYGLIHMTQPEGGIKDNYDVWFEMRDNEVQSYITCSEKLGQKHYPQCNHWLRIEQNFSIQISYNRDLLPEWKKISDNVKSMFESFQSAETASEFLQKQIELQQ